MNEAEWARDIVRRLDALESASTTRVGGWVLSSPGSDLVATAPGRRIVLSSPPVVESVPPAVTSGDLTDIIKAITNGIGETLQDLVQWGTDLLHNAGQVVGNIWDVVVQTGQTVGNFFQKLLDGLTGQIWDGATGFLGQLWQSSQSLFQRNETAYTYALAPRVFGAWQADLTDDVSFALSLIDARAKPQAGQRVLIPLTSHKARTDIDSVKVGMYGIPGACFMALYRVRREDATTPDAYGKLAKAGDATLLMDMGDVTALLRQTTADLKIIKLGDTVTEAGDSNPQQISTNGGDLLYLQVTQTGVTVDMATWSAAAPVVTGTQPKALQLARTGTFTGSTPVQDTFTATEVVSSGPGVAQYWGSMGKAIHQDATGPDNRRKYFDGFNRDPVSGAVAAVGPDWTIRQRGPYDPATFNPQIIGKRDVPAGDWGLQTSGCWVAHVNRLGTINQRVTFDVWWSDWETANDPAENNVYVHGDGSLRWVWCKVRYEPANRRWLTRIYTHISGVHTEKGLSNDGKTAGAYVLGFDEYPSIVNQFRFQVENENTYSVQFRLSSDPVDVWRTASTWVDLTDDFKVTDANTEFGLMTPLTQIGATLRRMSTIDNVLAEDI